MVVDVVKVILFVEVVVDVLVREVFVGVLVVIVDGDSSHELTAAILHA